MKIKDLLTKGYEILKSENIDSYLIDTQLILMNILQKDRIFLITNRDFEVEPSLEKDFLRLIEQRRNKKPIKYILGKAEFMGLEFLVEEGVLIPRGDTEILVESVLSYLEDSSYSSLCDVCCGSGIIGLSIAELSQISKVNLYDISEKAIEVTNKNIEKLLLKDMAVVQKSDLLENAINNKSYFDIVVSNPPYIRKDIIPTLMKDVKDYEPYIALCGGEDGLSFYREITRQSLKVLNKNGLLAFEIGYDQKVDVFKIMKDYGFKEIKCVKDLAGLDRVVIGKLI